MSADHDLRSGGSAHFVFTHWNTIFYLDAATGALRHGPPHEVPWNLLLIDIPQAEGPAGALLSPALGAGVGGSAADQGLVRNDPAETLLFERVPVDRDRLGLWSEGLYLCAEPDGRVTHSRERANAWETFKLAAAKKRHLSAIAQMRSALCSALRSPPAQDRGTERGVAKVEAAGGRRGVICDIDWLKTFIAREHYHFVRALHEDCGFDIIDARRTDFARERVIAELNAYDSLLIAYQWDAEIPTHRIATHSCFKIDDLEAYNARHTQRLADMARYADLLVGPCAYDMPRYFPHQRIASLPYSTSVRRDAEHVEFNETPIEKVLLSGSLAADRPFRQFVFGLDDPRLAKLGHPGYRLKYDGGEDQIVGKKWFELLNAYLCVFCDAHSLRYIHLRVFEATSVGALLLADRLVEGEMNGLGFVDRETCLFCDASDFLDKVAWILDRANRSEVDRIRRAGMAMCLERHTTQRRAREFAELIDRELAASAFRPCQGSDPSNDTR